MRKKKVLLVVPRYKSTVLPALIRAFGFLGWDFRVFDFRELNISEKTIVLVGKRDLAFTSLNKRLILSIKEYKPDIFFTVKGNNILPETTEEVRKNGGVSINWYPEDFRGYDLSKKLSKYYDVFLYEESFLVSYLKQETGKKAVYHFPFGADILPTDPYPTNRIKKYNLTSIGTPYFARLDLFPTIVDLGLDIWGDEFWAKTKLAKYWHGSLSFEQIFDIYAQSKIGISLDSSPIGNSVVNRVYEIMTSGTFCLSRSRPELGKYFKLDKEVVAFSSDTEFREKAVFYLKHEKEREIIAKAGYKASRSRHTYIQRLENLFKMLEI